MVSALAATAAAPAITGTAVPAVLAGAATDTLSKTLKNAVSWGRFPAHRLALFSILFERDLRSITNHLHGPGSIRSQALYLNPQRDKCQVVCGPIFAEPYYTRDKKITQDITETQKTRAFSFVFQGENMFCQPTTLFFWMSALSCAPMSAFDTVTFQPLHYSM
jgi:hypothetical protein